MDILRLVYEKLYTLCGGIDWKVAFFINTILVLGVNWGLSLVFLYTDITNKPKWMLQYKLQQDKNVPIDMSKLKKALKVAATHSVTLYLLFSYPTYWLQRAGGVRFALDELPSAWGTFYEIILIATIQEIVNYYIHRLEHHPYLYKWVHKQHHEWKAPVGIIAIYGTATETITGNILGVLIGPILIQGHMSTVLVWYIIAHFVNVFIHCGYHLPFLPSPQYHDYHHLKFNYNYGNIGILDWLHGTDGDFWKSPQGKQHRFLFGFTPIWKKYPHNKTSSNGHVE